MHRISDALNRLCEFGLVLLLSIMAVVVFLAVLFRYVLDLPLFWTEELARYCLIWSSLLGAAIALKRGEHIAVSFFMDHFPEKTKRVLGVMAQLSVVLILAVMLWGGIHLVIVASRQLSPALRIPMAVPYLALPFSSAVMLIHLIPSVFRGRNAVIQKEQP
jgi:TRAP-type C4-dicarboxylate transport system permease small subunit